MDEKVQVAAKRLVDVAALKGCQAKSAFQDAVVSVDARHEEIAGHVDTVAKASRVAAGVAALGAAIAAPTGLSAVGVALGVVSAPFIVTAAPTLLAVAGVAATVSAGTSLYSKARRKKQAEQVGK